MGTTLLLSFLILGVLIIAMSIGVIMGRKPIKGSCGGVGAALKEKNYKCSMCDGDPEKCENKDKNKAKTIDLQ